MMVENTVRITHQNAQAVSVTCQRTEGSIGFGVCPEYRDARVCVGQGRERNDKGVWGAPPCGIHRLWRACRDGGGCMLRAN
eukprot:1938122-Rhodomonas_salina.3